MRHTPSCCSPQPCAAAAHLLRCLPACRLCRWGLSWRSRDTAVRTTSRSTTQWSTRGCAAAFVAMRQPANGPLWLFASVCAGGMPQCPNADADRSRARPQECAAELMRGGHTDGIVVDVGMPVIHRGVRYNCRRAAAAPLRSTCAAASMTADIGGGPGTWVGRTLCCVYVASFNSAGCFCSTAGCCSSGRSCTWPMTATTGKQGGWASWPAFGPACKRRPQGVY